MSADNTLTPVLPTRFHFSNLTQYKRNNNLSFLKDAFVSVFTPSRYQSALSDGLISLVQEETLDESWIPVTEKEWREQKDNDLEFDQTSQNKKVISLKLMKVNFYQAAACYLLKMLKSISFEINYLRSLRLSPNS